MIISVYSYILVNENVDLMGENEFKFAFTCAISHTSGLLNVSPYICPGETSEHYGPADQAEHGTCSIFKYPGTVFKG